MKREYIYISYCGKYYCAFCDYYKGTTVEAAKNIGIESYMQLLKKRYGQAVTT